MIAKATFVLASAVIALPGVQYGGYNAMPYNNFAQPAFYPQTTTINQGYSYPTPSVGTLAYNTYNAVPYLGRSYTAALGGAQVVPNGNMDGHKMWMKPHEGGTPYEVPYGYTPQGVRYGSRW